MIAAEIPGEKRFDSYGEDLRDAFAVVMHAADCLRAPGGRVVAEAERRAHDIEQAPADSLEVLRETGALRPS